VVQHVPGGVPEFKDVEQQVEDTYFTSRMEPAMRDYLTTMREEAYIDYIPSDLWIPGPAPSRSSRF